MHDFGRISAILGVALMAIAAGNAPENLPADAPSAVLSPPTYGLAASDLDRPAPPAADSPAAPATFSAADALPFAPLAATRPPLRGATLADTVGMVRASESPDTGMSADMNCLATAVYFESKGEPLDGQLAVAQVIMNRVASGRFGRTVCDVVKAPRQFSFVRGGALRAPTNQSQFRTARAIAWIALNDAWSRIIGSATHFHATHVRPGWKLERVALIGNHIFYR
jgi:spore germination cell wall hydrolase CwlJ-like protein